MKKDLTKAAMTAMIAVTLCALIFAGWQAKRYNRVKRAYNAFMMQTDAQDRLEGLQGSDEYVNLNRAMQR